MRKISDVDFWNEQDYCRHPEHDPPGMIVLDPGVYEHECPQCGRKKIVTIPRKPMM